MTVSESRTASLSAESLESWTTDLLTRAGLDPTDAFSVAANIVEAEARGVRSHGLLLLPTYVRRIRAGGIRPGYEIKVVSDSGSVVVLDADGGPGQATAMRAAALAIERGRRHHVACVTVRNGNHVGMLATYGLRIAREGLVGMVMTNSGPSVGAYGGRGRLLGNQAFCVAVPNRPEPLVFDMATGTVACGKVRIAAQDGQSIPDGWVVDADDVPTTDPNRLDSGGSVTPLGGHKGYGLAVVIDVLTGLLSGGEPSPRVKNQRSNSSSPTGVSQTLVAIDPDRTAGTDRFVDDVRAYVDLLRSAEPMDERTPVVAPGDPELRAADQAVAGGIPLRETVMGLMDELASRLGVAPISGLATRMPVNHVGEPVAGDVKFRGGRG